MNESVEEFLRSLAGMPDEFLQCRAMRHAWEEEQPFTVVDSTRESGRRPRGGEQVYAERILACSRCGMQRSDAFRITSSNGHSALVKVGASYSPPPNYFVEGAGRLSSELVLGAKFDRDMAKVRVRRRR